MIFSKIRHNPLGGDRVVIAGNRGKRFEEKPPGCVFCPGNECYTPPPELLRLNIPFREGWSVRVVPNKYNALGIEGEPEKVGVGVYFEENGIGVHEVIVEHPYADHRHPAEMSVQETAMVFEAGKTRMKDLIKDKRFIYPLLFKNQGKESGASLEHPHSQLIVLTIVPRRVSEALDDCKDYFQRHKCCLLCQVIVDELGCFLGKRVVYENRSMVSWCVFSPRFPYETWIAPKKEFHSHSFENSGSDMLYDLAEAYLETLKRLKMVTKEGPFNVVLCNSPWFENDPRPSHGATLEKDFHWRLEILPRLSKIAGFEIGSGLYINSKFPEEAARELREISL